MFRRIENLEEFRKVAKQLLKLNPGSPSCKIINEEDIEVYIQKLTSSSFILMGLSGKYAFDFRVVEAGLYERPSLRSICKSGADLSTTAWSREVLVDSLNKKREKEIL